MKTTLEKLENNRAVLTVAVDKSVVAEALNNASRKIAKRVNIPGFRKGKAPRRIVERFVGKEAVWQEAIDPLLNKAYAEAVEQAGIQPIDRPEIDIIRMEEDADFEFKAEVDVLPEVHLGNYRDIKAEKEVKPVLPEDVEAELANIQEKHAELAVVEEPAQDGSFVSIDFQGYIDGEPFENSSAEGYLLEIGSGVFVGDFEQQLIGASAGEERSVKITFPEDYRMKDIAGKEAVFEVKINEVKQKRLPELNDELAEQEGFENLEELRKNIQNNLERKAEEEAERALQENVVKQVVDQVELDIPEVLIERHLDNMVEALRREVSGAGLTLEEYLEQAEKTQDDLRADLREQAERDVKTELVLNEIARQEQITVTDEEVYEDIDVAAAQYGQMADAIREFMRKPENFENIAVGLLKRKTLKFLVNLATGVESSSGEAAATDEAVGAAEEENKAQDAAHHDAKGSENDTTESSTDDGDSQAE